VALLLSGFVFPLRVRIVSVPLLVANQLLTIQPSFESFTILEGAPAAAL